MKHQSASSLHVVMFLPSIETGGVERNAILVANNFINYGTQVTVVFTRIVEKVGERFDTRVNLKAISKKIRIPGIHPRISDAIVIFFGFISFLRKLPKNKSVVILSFQSNIVAVIACIFTSIPIIVRVSNHPSHVEYESGRVQKIAEWLKIFIYRYSNLIITNSNVTSAYFRQNVPVAVETIYNPVNISELKKKAEAAVDHQWLLNKRIPVVVAVGRLVTQKNFPLLIRAFSYVLNQYEARLIILGEGSERGNLERLIGQLDLKGKVDLPGYDQNVHRFVARSDLFVLSSNFEGMPNALIEAIAVGVPVVATNCLSGPADILVDGEGGDLVPIGDVSALTKSILSNLVNIEETYIKHKIAMTKLGDFEHSKVMNRYRALVTRVANGE